MSVGLVYSDDCKRHRTGPDHPDQPERLDVILEALETHGLLRRLRRLPFAPASVEDLSLVHEPAYLHLLREVCEHGFSFIGDADTHISPESYRVAALATGGVLAACDAVMAGQVGRAFCALRPPGHHAERDQAMGFCLVNHVAVAAEHLVRRHGLARVAIVDFDAHHGNGTQHLFEDRSDVLYVSLHETPLSLKFPGSGRRGEVGRGAGRGFTRNVLLPHGADQSRYQRAFTEEVRPALEAFAPEFLLLSAGFDAQPTESLAHLNLPPEGFGWLTAALVDAVKTRGAVRLVSVLEGGYDLRGLGDCVAAHVRALLGRYRPAQRRG